MQKKITLYDLLIQGTVRRELLKFSPFARISMESITQETQVDQIDFFEQDGETTHFLHQFFPEKLTNTESSTKPKEPSLSLNLSMDGFYSQNAEEMPLTRTSTIPRELTLMADNGVHWNSSTLSLDRSSSLPVEAERALVRFGDLQTMRRAETGRRWLQEKLRRAAEAKKSAAAAAAAALKVPATSPAAVKLTILPNPSVDSPKYNAIFMSDSYDMPYTDPRGLAEGGASFNILTSSNKGKEIMVYPKPVAKVLPPRPAGIRLENPLKRPKLLEPYNFRYDDLAVLSKMPNVTTTGDGPGGKRIRGLLYTYRGGQVCIVCVCHGSFLTPEEFVMHAGGKNVVNPMKHITVCSNPF